MPKVDFFQAFGIPCNYKLDPEDLEEKYRKLAEQLHPDFFANSSSDLQRLSERASALINRAFEILSNPFARAEYLLEKKYSDLERKNRLLSPEFLQEMFSLQEKLDRLLEDKDRQGLEQMQNDLKNWHSELESGLLPAFEMLESAEKTLEVLEHLYMNLNANHYLKRLLERCVYEEML